MDLPFFTVHTTRQNPVVTNVSILIYVLNLKTMILMNIRMDFTNFSYSFDQFSYAFHKDKNSLAKYLQSLFMQSANSSLKIIKSKKIFSKLCYCDYLREPQTSFGSVSNPLLYNIFGTIPSCKMTFHCFFTSGQKHPIHQLISFLSLGILKSLDNSVKIVIVYQKHCYLRFISESKTPTL